MSFTFSTTIPAAANNPSVDQPVMLQNNVATNGIIGVDHITFNTANGGNHLQVHLPAFTAPTVVNGTGTQGSVIYSVAGVADSSYAQLTFLNARSLNFPLNLIRAYALSDTNGNVISSQSFNVTSIARSGPGTSYTITLPANVVTGTTNYAVFSQATDFNIILNSTPSNATTFVTRSITNTGINQYPVGNWSFFVIQL